MDIGTYKNVADNVGSTNLVDTATYKKLTIECCTTIINLLSNHCGRFSYNSLLIQHDKHADPTSPFKNVFTKDGISIVKTLNFYNPIQNHIKDMIAYVGDRVDRVSYDGTTTSMLMFAMLLRRYCQIDSITHDHVDRLTSLLDMMGEVIELNKVTIPDLIAEFGITQEEATRFVVYTEAMVSSKGDVELANALAKVITRLPPELYSQFHFFQSEMESKDRFTIIDEDYDFQIEASFISPDLYNSNVGTEYVNDDCNLLVIQDSLTTGHPFLPILRETLEEIIHSSEEERNKYTYITEKDIVIVAPEFASALIMDIKSYNTVNKHKIVPIQMVGSASQKDIRLCVVNALASTYSIDTILADRVNWYEHAFIKNAGISFKHRLLDFKNLYAKYEDAIYTPNYLARDTENAFRPFDDLFNEISAFLDKHIKKHVKVSTNQELLNLKHYIRIYQKMVCSKMCSLQISGSTHDSLADFSVVQDAFGAICATLERGFIFDGFWAIYNNTDDPILKKIIDTVFMTMSHKTYNDLMVTKSNKYFYSFIDEDRNVFTSRLDKKAILNPETTEVLIQPSAGFLELIRRMKELLPKLLLTTDVIVPNLINTNTGSSVKE